MSRSGREADPVVVVGGGLAGLAAAARLAKLGHTVRLVEAGGALGGPWAAYAVEGRAVEGLAVEGLAVDDAPSVLTFPAPWRDLFRKSGRTLEAELARTGHALVPAPPAHYVFADGSDLSLPTDRGEQFRAVGNAYGVSVAERWRDLLDTLDDVWQVVRPLGLESELPARSLIGRSTLRRLTPRRSIEHLARDLDHPQLGAVVRSVAHRLGSTPRTTPAWCAVQLSVERRFGRWTVQDQSGDPGRTVALLDALIARLQLRKVTVDLSRPVASVELADGAVAGIRLVDGTRQPASAVIAALDPWSVLDLLPVRPADLRAVRRLRPALAPAVSHVRRAEGVGDVSETVVLDRHGVPTVHYRRPAEGGSLESVHDYRDARPRPGAGAAWAGFGSWFRRPPVTTSVPGLFLAGPASAAGSSPSSVVLSGALAAYGADKLLAAPRSAR